MANEKVGVTIEADASQAVKSVGSIRKEIKEATIALQEAQKEFGDYSKEAIAAAKRVAELKDTVAEAAETAALFDPGAKFAAFGGALNAVAGGFAAVQGALGLVGVESEDLQKQLLKVQSALALSEGLSKVTDSAKDFQRLNAVVQQSAVFQKGLAAANLATAAAQKALGIATVTTSTGFKVLRGAIIGTGIGALAIGLIALVQNFDKVKQVVTNLIPGLGAIADAIGNIYNRITDFIGITSAAGREAEKVLKANAAAIKATERELEINGDKYDQYSKRKIEADLNYRKSFEQLNKDKTLSEAELNKSLKDIQDRRNRDIISADKDRQSEVDKANQEAAKKASADQKANADKLSAEQKAINEARRAEDAAEFEKEKQFQLEKRSQIADAEKELLAAQREEQLKAIEDDRARELQKLEFDFEEKRTLYADNFEALKILEETYLIEQKAIKDKFDEINEEKAVQLGLAQLARLTAQRKQKADDAAADIAIEEAKRDAQLATFDALGAGIANLANLIGQNTAAGKAIAIAGATIDTYAATASQFNAASKNPITTFNPAYPFIIAASALVAGIARVRQIASVKVPNSSGGGGAAPSIGGGGAGAAPSVSGAAPLQPFRREAQVFELGQRSLSGINTASQRAYVVESDITSSQERISRLNRAARLG
jgi:hypothetical protein